MSELKVNKSELIRKFNKDGKSRSEIAKLLNIKYQFVRNVLENEKNKINKEFSQMELFEKE